MDQNIYIFFLFLDTGFLILLPFRFFYSAFYDILSFVYRLFRPDPRLMVTDPLGEFDKVTRVVFGGSFRPVYKLLLSLTSYVISRGCYAAHKLI